MADNESMELTFLLAVCGYTRIWIGQLHGAEREHGYSDKFSVTTIKHGDGGFFYLHCIMNKFFQDLGVP